MDRQFRQKHVQERQFKCLRNNCHFDSSTDWGLQRYNNEVHLKTTVYN